MLWPYLVLRVAFRNTLSGIFLSNILLYRLLGILIP
jgi:hypothetical protein